MPSNPVNFTEIPIETTTDIYSYRSVAIGDLNGDGLPDAVLPNDRSDSVSVLLNNGTGGFNAQTTYSTIGSGNSSGSPTSVAISDFNGDSNADLVVFNRSGSNVSVLLGTSSGGFSTATTFASSDFDSGFGVVDDFNNDGKPDLFVGSYSYQGGSVLLNDGNGSFSAPTFIAGTGYSVVATGDFNGDGKRDLVTAGDIESNKGGSVFLGTGTGSFGSGTTFATGGESEYYSGIPIVVGDLNGDGKQDLVVVTRSYRTHLTS